MDVKKIFAVALSVFAASFAELYSPAAWYGFRTDSLVFSAGAGDSDTLKTVVYELLEKRLGAKSNVLSTKTIKPDAKEWSLVFTGLKKDVVGKDALWVKEAIGNEKAKIYGPYGFIKSPLLQTCDTLQKHSGSFKNYKTDNVKFAGDDNLPLQISYNKDGLIIAVGASKEKITVSIDPANGKTAFLAFANRIIMCDTTDKKASFFYPERNVDVKATDIQYKIRDWEGDMEVFNSKNGRIIFIPWYDFGIKYEDGRKFGIMIQNGAYSYPVGASPYSPASWGNVILK